MGQYRIGGLCGHKPYGYGQDLSLGMRDAITELGHIYVMIADQVPYHINHHYYDYMHVAFQMARQMDLDAYILPAGVLYQLTNRQVGDKGLQLIELFEPEKTIIVEREVAGYHCITKDNAAGMHECMRHLIEDHGYQRIAFISGPENSRGARERERIFFDEMEAHGLSVQPEMFERGRFDGRCDNVVEKIIDNNKGLEAIACACDEIAMAVYRVAERRGILIGKELAVTGFDDLPEVVHLDPPLSTVHTTGYDIGYMAGQAAVRLCEGKPLGQTVLKSRFIARASCGESRVSQTERFKELLLMDPVPMDRIVQEMIDSSYTSVGGAIRNRFEANMTEFCRYMESMCKERIAHPEKQIYLFSTQLLSEILLDPKTRPYMLPSGFQTALNAFLHALRDIVRKEDELWVVEQSAHLHLRLSRIFQGQNDKDLVDRNELEMHTIQIVDDAMEDNDSRAQTYRRILGELQAVGVRNAWIYVFHNNTVFVDRDDLTLEDKALFRGSLVNGQIRVSETDEEHLLGEVLRDCAKDTKLPSGITVSGLLAHNEIYGFVVMSQDELAVNEQMAVFLMLGYSIKHLQMMAHEREMIEMLNESNVMLTHQSQQDELTGLLNRRGFLLMTDILIRNNVGKRAAVFYLDLDGLKTINDTYGHDIGDDAIKNTAQILSSCFRSADLIGRQGGDEFVAFSIVKQESDVQIISRRVEQRMKVFNEEHDLVYTLSISVGVRAFVIEEDTAGQLDHLMGEADEMLYEVKRRRKGSRRFSHEEIP